MNDSGSSMSPQRLPVKLASSLSDSVPTEERRVRAMIQLDKGSHEIDRDLDNCVVVGTRGAHSYSLDIRKCAIIGTLTLLAEEGLNDIQIMLPKSAAIVCEQSSAALTLKIQSLFAQSSVTVTATAKQPDSWCNLHFTGPGETTGECTLVFNGFSAMSIENVTLVAPRLDLSRCKHLTLDRCLIKNISIGSALENLNVTNARLLHVTVSAPIKFLHMHSVTMDEGELHPRNVIRATLMDLVLVGTVVDHELFEHIGVQRETLDVRRSKGADTWHTLRDSYSGFLLAVHLMFFVIFFLPLISKVALLYVIGMWSDSPKLLALVENGLAVERKDLWYILLFGAGTEGWVPWLHAASTVGALYYNAARLFLTVTVARQKNSESRWRDYGFKAIRPVGGPFMGFQYGLHQLNTYVFYLLLINIAMRLWQVAQLRIPIIELR